MIFTIYCWIAILFISIFFTISGIILSFLSPDKVIKYSIRPWGYFILKACRINVIVEGLENLPREPCVIMYNHQSSFDIFLFCGYLPIEWKAIIKDELASLPLLGWVTRLSGHYFVSRDQSSRDTEEVKKIARKIRSGPSVIIAPEGTRSDDGKLLPFKKGGFIIAMLAGTPVVPMALVGGKDIMPKGSLRIKPGKMWMKILPQIDIKNLPPGRLGRELLEKTVRDSMEKTLGEGEKLKIAS